MKQEDKELLLKDLCARLPYGVKIELTWWVMGEGTYINTILELDHIEQLVNDEDGDTEIKPYLRPMSSMTKEEKKNLIVAVVGNEASKYFRVLQDGSIDNTDATIQDLNTFNLHWVIFDKDTVTLYLDWLNAHHFDYRGLIEKGLAIEVTKENNVYKD